ncbi:MAG TPA: type II toxin-antitoxin system RelE/ParE family toxin [Ktedonobacteraceae bacterium]|nr:type II toxin-antitoxin system RelE/ParE family toxin [Ktedonobacteraceae bacterium]
MQFSVRFYYDSDGNKPVSAFLEDLRKQDKILHKLVVAGIKKLEMSERHGPPLTELVDQKYDIFELRIGDKNIARVFFFFQQGQEIIMTNGYVKKQQKVDTGELERARTYKKDWKERQL